MATFEGIIDYVDRSTELGDTRITEDGNVRVGEQWNPESIAVNDAVLPQWILSVAISETGNAQDVLVSAWDETLAESAAVSETLIVSGTLVGCWLEIEGNDTFAVGDILRIKEGTDDEWLEVIGIASAPIYRVTRDKAEMYADGSNPAWTKGASVSSYGQSGDGGIYITASDTNAPNLSVFTHGGSPWNDITTHLRLGNLNGYLGYSSDLYGIAIGETDKYLKYDPTNGLRISGNALVNGTITADKYAELRQTYVFTNEDSLDTSYPFEIPFRIVSETTSIVSVRVSFKIKPFRAYSTGAASGGGQTSSEGGGQTSSSSGTAHTHTLNIQYGGEGYAVYLYEGILSSPGGAAGQATSGASAINHTHTVNNHTHTVDNHTHSIVFGLYEEDNLPTIHFHVDNGSGYGGASGNYTSDQADVDITSDISGTGWKGLKFDTSARCRISAIIECKVDVTA